MRAGSPRSGARPSWPHPHETGGGGDLPDAAAVDNSFASLLLPQGSRDMTPPTDAVEPPMEEILASIRRIIAEEPATSAGEPDAGTVTAEPAPADVDEGARAPEMDRADESVDAQGTDDDAAPVGSVETDVLVSEAASARATSAFDRLASTREERAPTHPDYAMPASGRSLEDVTRELLAPLLKDWLDERLPGIVEARVDEEVTRIARGRVR